MPRHWPRGFRWSTSAAFALVVLAALWLRVDALNWDDATYPHPDERFMTMVVAALHSGRLSLPGATDAERSMHRDECLSRNGRGEGVGDWFDTLCSDFNPANVGYAAYPYGTLPLAAVRLVAEGWRAISGHAGITQYGEIHRVGRLFSAACDVLTLLATFLLGRLLWDARTGLLAMAFYAFAVLPVQGAHFWTVDASVTLFVTVALIFLVRLSRFGQRADAAAFGVAAGMALACKISIAPLVLLLPLAVLLAPARVAFARRPDTATRVAVLLPVVAIAGVALLATYRVASPFAFHGPYPPSCTNWPSRYDLHPEASTFRRIGNGSAVHRGFTPAVISSYGVSGRRSASRPSRASWCAPLACCVGDPDHALARVC
jgi:hypothetical protein